MSRKYPRPIPHFRPVSQNAYDTFIRRIYAVVPMDHRCGAMVEALDKYLAGDRETYASELDEHTAITFEMLRFEIDKAIERSARARRPRRRKTAQEVSVPISSQTFDKPTDTMPDHVGEGDQSTESDDKKASTVNTAETLNSVREVNESNDPDLSDSLPSGDEPEPMLPRRVRRAAILAMRPRRKWKKIG